MKPSSKWIWLIIGLGCLSIWGLCYQKAGSTQQNSIAPVAFQTITATYTNQNPEWSLPDLDGRLFRSQELKGTVAFIHFWATWCPPCVAELPHLVALQRNYEEQLRIIGISLSQIDRVTLKRFVEQHALNYTILEGNQQIVEQFGNFSSIPTSFLVNRDGRIIKIYVGLVPQAVLEAEVNRLL